MIKKIIGIILVCVIFFLAIKALTFLPTLNNAVIGPNKSPFQIGTDYVDQINKMYPVESNYGNQKARQEQQASYATQTNTKIAYKITLEKSFGKLILSVEDGNPTEALNIWLTNTPEITDQTEYIDFGLLQKNVSIKQYVIDMKGGDISLAEFKYVLIVDKDQKLKARVVLK